MRFYVSVLGYGHKREIEGRKVGIKEGRKEGRKEGIKEEKIIIAKKMKKSGQSIDYINEMTGLTIEEITKL